MSSSCARLGLLGQWYSGERRPRPPGRSRSCPEERRPLPAGVRLLVTSRACVGERRGRRASRSRGGLAPGGPRGKRFPWAARWIARRTSTDWGSPSTWPSSAAVPLAWGGGGGGLRGYRTVLVEARDFAQGTSRPVTGVARGVRTWPRNVGLVREALRERGGCSTTPPSWERLSSPPTPGGPAPYYGVGSSSTTCSPGAVGKSQLLSRAQVLERIPTEPTSSRGRSVLRRPVRRCAAGGDAGADRGRPGSGAVNWAPVVGLSRNGGA